jgi:hypothetical protein
LSFLEYAQLSPSNAGRYLLMNGWNDRVQRIDLATGRISTVPGKQAYRLSVVAW